jgi:hypothetical protein
VAAANGNKKSNNGSNASATTTTKAPALSAFALWSLTEGPKYQNYAGQLANASRAISNAASANNFSAMTSGCARLKSIAERMQQLPPVPDALAAAKISSGLSYFVAGAEACISGVQNVDAATVTQAATDVVQGSKQIDAATARLGQLNG